MGIQIDLVSISAVSFKIESKHSGHDLIFIEKENFLQMLKHKNGGLIFVVETQYC